MELKGRTVTGELVVNDLTSIGKGEICFMGNEFVPYSVQLSKYGVTIKSRKKSNIMLGNGKMQDDEIKQEVWAISNGLLEKRPQLTTYGRMTQAYLVPEKEEWNDVSED